MDQKLNSRQKEAVHAPDRPLLIVAGAGTGKTKTLTARLIHLIETGTDPASIAALTFTNKAAKEMASRVKAGLPGGLSGEPFIGTLHSFGARLLRKECRALGRTPNFVIYDDHDAFQLIKNILKRGVEPEKLKEGPGYFSDLFSKLKNGLITKEELRDSALPDNRRAVDFFETYENALRANNAFDFDDLIQKVVFLFSNHPEILAKYRAQYRCILVDEYQDLNNTQYELVKHLIGHTKALSVVGDDQQTIYSWRGSNFEIFLNFENDWPESTVVVLDQNYRSSGVIIRAASELIAHNTHQKPKTLWTENAPGALVHLVEAKDEAMEARFVAEHIRSSDPNETTAILYRTNAQSRAIEQALLAMNIPYEIYGGIKFYERREVKDVLAALRYVSNRQDSISLERIEKAFTKARFRSFQEFVRTADGMSPTELIGGFLKTTDYFEYIQKNMTNLEERRENIAELIRFSTGFQELAPFLEEITLLQATDTLNQPLDREPVRLMTVHLAKGLEFDRVFVIGCVEGLLPHARSMQNLAETEEERRLMYVAMTRARRDLTLSFYDVPSRFLSEIPSELMEYTSLVSEDTVFVDDEERYISWDE